MLVLTLTRAGNTALIMKKEEQQWTDFSHRSTATGATEALKGDV